MKERKYDRSKEKKVDYVLISCSIRNFTHYNKGKKKDGSSKELEETDFSKEKWMTRKKCTKSGDGKKNDLKFDFMKEMKRRRMKEE